MTFDCIHLAFTSILSFKIDLQNSLINIFLQIKMLNDEHDGWYFILKLFEIDNIIYFKMSRSLDLEIITRPNTGGSLLP